MSLKGVSKKQLEPILHLHLDNTERYLYISNLGRTPAFNVTIDTVEINGDRFEFNILRPIYCIGPEKDIKLEITYSKDQIRSFDKNIEVIRLAMIANHLTSKVFRMHYDTNFGEKKKIDYVFDISDFLYNESDPMRICRIYPLVW
jgi:hypothetical protein